MAQTQVVMPKMSMTMTEGEVVEINVKVGDLITQGQVVAVVGTDKTDMEVESDHEGEVIEILAASGDVLPVGAGLIMLETKGEDLLAGLFGSAPEAEVVTEAPSPVIATEAIESEPDQVPEQVPASEILAMPGARELAAELGIDLAGVKPKSATGVIKQSDLQSSMDPDRQARARVQIARVVESSLLIPQLSVTGMVTVSKNLPAEQTLRLEQLVAAWELTLHANPKLNASFTGEGFVSPEEIRVAVLLSTQLGFVSPVVPLSADWKASFGSIIAAARLNKIDLANLQGATTSVTDLSDYPIVQANTLLMAGQSSGVNIGKVRTSGERFEIGVTIVLDHRIADPGDAAMALVSFARALNEVLNGHR
jgi:pyruvate dehydrogenase E2 component (dihydrolipoamide acetyltransferase)